MKALKEYVAFREAIERLVMDWARRLPADRSQSIDGDAYILITPEEAVHLAAQAYRAAEAALSTPAPTTTAEQEESMTDDQIKHMVNRFLAWRLPENFNPDNGISFDRVANLGTEHQWFREPVGTNLLDAVQAEAMVRHMVEGMPQQQRQDRGGGVRNVLANVVEHQFGDAVTARAIRGRVPYTMIAVEQALAALASASPPAAEEG